MTDDATRRPTAPGPVERSMGPPVQLAYAVDDVRDAAAGWVPLGVGPFFVMEHIELGETRINGSPATFDHSSAYGWWGDLMFELICQHDTPATDRPSNRPSNRIVGSGGLHHVAHFVDDLDAVSSGLVVDGHAEVLRAETAGGMGFAFHDGGPTRGHLIEIYEPVARLRAFYDMVRDASVGWDGSDPVRTL
ncbi:MAG: VOC family protein [Ilumatobacter sp.]|uniref:VOC family protein n=1 Tax=Ilumatobacter sp. TaxID=1967498 RepID=UPI00329706A9